MKRRTGFTIVELLVSLALIVLIMAVMSEAFVSGLDSVSHLKATGDMQERLRVGAAPLRHDLLARHFESEEKVSNITQMPSGGFFRIVQNGYFADSVNDPTRWEGVDGDYIPSYRSAGCQLHFTVRNTVTNSSRREDFYSARVPSGSPPQAASPTAFRQAGIGLDDAIEVRYFLYRDPSSTETAGNLPAGVGLPLYSLHRRQKVIHGRVGSATASGATVTGYAESAIVHDTTASPSMIYFPNLKDLASPQAQATLPLPGKFGGTRLTNDRTVLPTPVSPSFVGDVFQRGDDLVMTDVLSFTVEVLVQGQFEFKPLSQLYAQVSPGVWEYDTGNRAQYAPATNNLLPAYRLRGIKITMRVWDFKKQLSRQITVIDEL